jgi:hypothetical protein
MCVITITTERCAGMEPREEMQAKKVLRFSNVPAEAAERPGLVLGAAAWYADCARVAATITPESY